LANAAALQLYLGCRLHHHRYTVTSDRTHDVRDRQGAIEMLRRYRPMSACFGCISHTVGQYLADHTFVTVELMIRIVVYLSVVVCNGCIVTKR